MRVILAFFTVLLLSSQAYAQNYNYYKKTEHSQLGKKAAVMFAIDGIAIGTSAGLLKLIDKLEVKTWAKYFPEVTSEISGVGKTIVNSKTQIEALTIRLEDMKLRARVVNMEKLIKIEGEIVRIEKHLATYTKALAEQEARLLKLNSSYQSMKTNMLSFKGGKSLPESMKKTISRLSKLKKAKGIVTGLGVLMAVDFMAKTGLLLRSTDDIDILPGSGVYKSVDYLLN